MQGQAEWAARLTESSLTVADFPTTRSNVQLASEALHSTLVVKLSASAVMESLQVTEKLTASSKAQAVHVGLTFLALKTGLPITFALQAAPVAALKGNHYHNGSLAIGGNDVSEHDDFSMSFRHGSTPFSVFAFGMHLVGNDISEGEASPLPPLMAAAWPLTAMVRQALRVYNPQDQCIAVLETIPVSTGKSAVFIGVLATQPLGRVFFGGCAHVATLCPDSHLTAT